MLRCTSAKTAEYCKQWSLDKLMMLLKSSLLHYYCKYIAYQPKYKPTPLYIVMILDLCHWPSPVGIRQSVEIKRSCARYNNAPLLCFRLYCVVFDPSVGIVTCDLFLISCDIWSHFYRMLIWHERSNDIFKSEPNLSMKCQEISHKRPHLHKQPISQVRFCFTYCQQIQ